MSETFPRRVVLDGAVNFRDIGGYPAANGRRIRWRRVFRSDNLGDLTAADGQRLVDLGIRTLVDFRLPAERHRLPNRLAANSAIETVEIGFLPEGIGDVLRAAARGTVDRDELERAFTQQYRSFVTDHSSEFARALGHALQERSLPLLMHCTSGKDRTGFAISALLLALGTPQETILDDYALTNSYQREIAHLFSASTPPELTRLLMLAQPKYLEAAFDQIRTSYGTVDAYLAQALGLGDEQRSKLAELLTEDA